MDAIQNWEHFMTKRVIICVRYLQRDQQNFCKTTYNQSLRRT